MQNIKGIVRKADKLGRIVLPKEMRKVFDIELGTEIDIYIVRDKIVLKVVKGLQ